MSTEASPSSAVDKPAALLPPETRLESSRLALRAAMTPPPTTAKPASGALVDKLRAVPPLDALLSHPAVSTARDTLRQWWLAHPWRPLLTVGIEAGKQAVMPLARRHPMRLLGAAMLGGAVLSRWRPWKWIIASAAPALAASLLPTLISRAATRIPLSALLKIVGSSSKTVRVREAGVPARTVTTVTVSEEKP